MKRLLAVALGAVVIAGCATGITDRQKIEYEKYKARGLAQEEKSPGVGAVLGLLPGGGSFYGREYGLGVVNLLFWPLSILWDPLSGANASERINYIATKEYVSQEQIREINQLNQNRMAGLVDDSTYRAELMGINQKYDINSTPQSLPVYYSVPPVKSINQSEKDQKIQALQQQNLPYAEYQRRYREIMEQ